MPLSEDDDYGSPFSDCDEYGSIEDDDLLRVGNIKDEDYGSPFSEYNDYGDVKDEDFLSAEHMNDKKHDIQPDSNFDQPPSKRQKLDLSNFTTDVDVIALAKAFLEANWGFSSFKLKQEAVIARLITGGSAAVVFPTGGGKSLTYQIPALAFDSYDECCGRTVSGGLTIVVSPLIALMKDQVDALKKLGIAAGALDSSRSSGAQRATERQIRRNELRLLYVAPERLNHEDFIEMIRKTRIRMLAVDEAHCISEWGHAFRPDYLKIARFVKEIQAERVLCLTATATPKVADDICAAFNIDQQGLFRTTTYRPNLRLLAQFFTSESEKIVSLKDFLRKNEGPAIIYVQTRRQTDVVCAELRSSGFNAFGYHAGMKTDARTSVQDEFMQSEDIVIVATIAFGMGIDKPNIRNIVHFAMPRTMESYSQEIGRAGRDGRGSTCMIYLCYEDTIILEQWARADIPSLRSIEGLVRELLETHKDVKVGDVIERNLPQESRHWDITENALNLLNAQLELQFELIRAVGLRNSFFKYNKSIEFERMTLDGSRVTEAIKRCSVETATTWMNIDVDAGARDGGFSPQDAEHRLRDWSNMGVIQLQRQLNGVLHRFRVLRELPRDELTRSNICNLVYKQMEEKERQDLERIQRVIDFVTTSGCLSRELARHFGDESSLPEEGCGNCQYCLTKGAVRPKREGSRKGRIDDAKIRAILSATAVRDDAKFLARVGFGISSPRVRTEKLGKHRVFGSLSDCDFEELVDTFREFCNQ